MSLEDKLDKWAKSDAGKKQLNVAMRKKAKDITSTNTHFGADGKMSLEDIAYNVISIFDYHIRHGQKIDDKVINSFVFGDYLEFSDYRVIDIDGEPMWELHINFVGQDNLHRDSWFPEGYYGAYDIVELMNNGYVADDHVYLKYEDENGVKKSMPSLKEREGAHFMNRAEFDINQYIEQNGFWVEIHPRFVDNFGV